MNEATAPSEKWWYFKITDEQADEIRHGNKTAINSFYTDNERLIRNICKKAINLFSRLREVVFGRMYCIDDAMYQIYVDLSSYRFENSRQLYGCMMRSVIYMERGGYTAKCGRFGVIVSLDSALPGKDGDEGRTYGDIIASPEILTDELAEDVELLYTTIAARIYPLSLVKQAELLSRI